jgi:hypothetical protein
MADTSSLTSNETLKSIFGDGMSFELPKELKPDAIIASAKKEGEAIKSYRAKESEVEKAQAAGAARSASELSAKYEPQFQKTPDFAPSEENKAALVGMFGLLGAIGAMGGGKSYGSALGAMNAMGGMLKGYQQGRKDLFEREKAEYDKHVQAVKSHNDEITKAYARAQNVAKTNLAKADADLKSTLRSMGADMEASKVEREGISKAYDSHIKAMNAGANAYKQYASVIEKLQKASGVTGGVGAIPTLSRLIEEPNLGAIKPKEAEGIVGRVNTVYNTERLINEAKDPDINFGEISRFATRFQQAIRRNLENKDTVKSDMDVSSAINQASDEAGMDPNDKNVVFFKKAIFTAMELEREARGGSILPVAMMKQLTPLLDPAQTTREAYVGILQDRERELRQKSGLTNQQLDKALGNLRKQFGTQAPAAAAASSGQIASSDDVKATADARFGGDIEAAKKALRNRGFKIEGE